MKFEQKLALIKFVDGPWDQMTYTAKIIIYYKVLINDFFQCLPSFRLS